MAVSEPTRTADKPVDFYSARYSSERQKLRDVIFAEVYDNYFGQSSWVSTADYDRFAGWLELSSESRLLDIACGSGQPSLRIAAGTGCRVSGVDSSGQAIATAISMAQDKGLASRSRFECADAARPLRYPDASFGALMCIDALAHFSVGCCATLPRRRCAPPSACQDRDVSGHDRLNVEVPSNRNDSERFE